MSGFRKLNVLKTGKGFDNSDLRLINVKEEDELYYKHRIFIERWQKSSSPADAARRLGMSVRQVNQKVCWLRAKKGMKYLLKRFNLTQEEVKKLKEVATRTVPKKTVFDEKKEKVIFWNRAKSIDEFAKRFKMERREAQLWGAWMRGNGYDMQKFHAYGKNPRGRG